MACLLILKNVLLKIREYCIDDSSESRGRMKFILSSKKCLQKTKFLYFLFIKNVLQKTPVSGIDGSGGWWYESEHRWHPQSMFLAWMVFEIVSPIWVWVQMASYKKFFHFSIMWLLFFQKLWFKTHVSGTGGPLNII